MANKFTVSTVFKAHDQMTKTVKKMNKATSGFSKTLRLLKVAVAGGIVFKGFQFLTKEASQIEDDTAAFIPLMGGVKKANKLVDELNKTAATTPFQFENISKAAMQLLPVMNQDIEKTVKTFRMLGDTAGGNAQKLDSITRGFTKSMLKGKVDMESLNMIAEAGVPIFSEMAKSMGISKEKLFDMSKAGKLTTNALTNTFQAMTSEGGIFYKGMEIASKTLTGKMSTLKDNIKLTAAALGKNLLPILKPIIDDLIKLAGRAKEWVIVNQDLIRQKLNEAIEKIKSVTKKLVVIFKKLEPVLIAIVIAIVAYRTALLVLIIAQKAAMIIQALTKAYQVAAAMIMLYQSGAKIATIAQFALNAAFAANPIGLIIIGIAALIAIIILLVKHWDKVKAAVVRVWNWFSKLLDNPLIAAAALIFAPFLAIPAMKIKHWTPLKEFFVGLWEKI